MSINNIDWHRKQQQLQNQTLRGTNQSSGRSSVGNRGIDKNILAGGLTGGGIGSDAINTDQLGNVQTSTHLNHQHSVLPLVIDATIEIDTFSASNYTTDIKIHGPSGPGTDITVHRPDGTVMLCPAIVSGSGHNFVSAQSVYVMVYYDVFNDINGNGKFVAVWKSTPFTALELATAYQDTRVPLLATPGNTNTGLTSGTSGTYMQTLFTPGGNAANSGGGSGLVSINSDTTPNQIITNGPGISVSTVSGTTTITNTMSGGNTSPTVIQAKFAGPSAASITLDQGPANGNSVILFLNMFNTGTATSVSSTNTTWTKVKTFTSGGAAIYDLWIGIVSGGIGGAVITITHPNTFNSCTAVETTIALTPTLGANTTASTTNGLYHLSGATSGHLIIMCAGPDNTTSGITQIPVNMGSSSGVSTTQATVMLTFAIANPTYTSLSTPAGGLIIAEIT